jgi:hypothetical protein
MIEWQFFIWYAYDILADYWHTIPRDSTLHNAVVQLGDSELLFIPLNKLAYTRGVSRPDVAHTQ